MKMIFDNVNYARYMWDFCSDLKVIALVTGMQTGHTKFMCCLCEFDTRSKEHYVRKIWPPKPGEIN